MLATLLLKALDRLAGFKILRGVHVAEPDSAFLTCRYACMFLSEAQLRSFARDPASEMSERFIDQALARGDECFAILDGDKLAAYGWYSFKPTPIGLPDLVLRFGTDWVYTYKGFTDPRYRGKRLHGIGMSMALRHYRDKGYKGLVSYVESTNRSSLKSCFRMGCGVFGSVYLVRLFGRYFALSGPGCERFEFRVEREPARAGITRTPAVVPQS